MKVFEHLNKDFVYIINDTKSSNPISVKKEKVIGVEEKGARFVIRYPIDSMDFIVAPKFHTVGDGFWKFFATSIDGVEEVVSFINERRIKERKAKIEALKKEIIDIETSKYNLR